MRSPCHALIAATIVLAACDNVPVDDMTVSNSTSSAARLRMGDAMVCVDAGVEETLRSLVRPDAAGPDRYDIAFEATSLEAFDASVYKASCSTTVRVVTNDGHTLADTTLPYTVKPSSRDPQRFVVTALTGFLKQQLTEAMLADDAAAQQQQQQADDQRALLAIVKPTWLAGRWASADQADDACHAGPYMEFGVEHQLLGRTGRGTWQLDGVQLTYSAGAAMTDAAITNADANSFAMLDEDGRTTFMRRCAAEAPPEPAASQPTPTMKLPATFGQPS